MLRLLAISVFNITFLSLLSGQSLEQQLSQLESEVQQLERSKAQLLRRMEDVKLQKLRRDLAAWGLPKLNQADQPIEHSGLSLLYDEKHEQARWVAHIIIADVLNGKLPRSNDFRPDPKVSSGSAVEADYFLKYLQADSTYKYDGFGYDRGHLAASADFNWSQEAMSDTYYYSNMAPQLADFNRGKWAELEALLRGYLYHHPQTQLYVCTGGHLEDGLPSIPRSQHKVSIPKYFWKVVIDLKNEKGIGFWMPHKALDYPVEYYSCTIDSIEQLTGIDFYNALEDTLEDQLERQNKAADWIPELANGDVLPVAFEKLGRKMYNTVMAAKLIGVNENVSVIGTVVSGRKSRKGNLILNLDKQYPKQIFNIFIRKEDLIHFDSDPLQAFKGKQIIVYGRVKSLGKTPTMYIKNGSNIRLRP